MQYFFMDNNMYKHSEGAAREIPAVTHVSSILEIISAEFCKITDAKTFELEMLCKSKSFT